MWLTVYWGLLLQSPKVHQLSNIHRIAQPKKRKTVLGYHVDIILASLRNFLSYRLQLIWMHFTTPISVRVYLRKISTEPLSSHLTLLCSCRLKTNLGFLCPILVSSMFLFIFCFSIWYSLKSEFLWETSK